VVWGSLYYIKFKKNTIMVNEADNSSWLDLIPGGIWNEDAEQMSKDLQFIAKQTKLTVVKVSNIQNAEASKWARKFPGVLPLKNRQGPKGALYDPKGDVHFDVLLPHRDEPNSYYFDGPEFSEILTIKEFIHYISFASGVNSFAKSTRKRNMTESVWSRYSSTDEQEQCILDLENAIKAKKLTITGANTIGKRPQTVILDVNGRQGAFYIGIDYYTDECYIDVLGRDEYRFMSGWEEEAVKKYLEIIKTMKESTKETCTEKDLVVFDNGGETIDRYTVFCRKWVGDGKYGYIAMSDEPELGFSQHGEGRIPSGSVTNIGKKIKFSKLPTKVQKHFWRRANQGIWETSLSEKQSRPENYFLFVVDKEERGEFAAHVEDYKRNVVFEFTYPNHQFDNDGQIESEDSFFEDGWVRNYDDLDGWKDYLEHLGILSPADTLTRDEDEFEEYINGELELAESKNRTFDEAIQEYHSYGSSLNESKSSSGTIIRMNKDGLRAVVTTEGELNDSDPATLEVFNDTGVKVKTIKYTYDGNAKTEIELFWRINGFKPKIIYVEHGAQAGQLQEGIIKGNAIVFT
jgi:hypothetical protein